MRPYSQFLGTGLASLFLLGCPAGGDTSSGNDPTGTEAGVTTSGSATGTAATTAEPTTAGPTTAPPTTTADSVTTAETGNETSTGADTNTDTGEVGMPLFEPDIVPIFNKSCGSGDNACHSRVAYSADAKSECRGWLALEDTPLGASYYAGPDMGKPTGCPDIELYDRLMQLDAWQCETFDPRMRYVVPCKPEESYVFQKINGGPYCAQDSGGMPLPSQAMPLGKVMDAKEVATIKTWIEAGAPRIETLDDLRIDFRAIGAHLLAIESAGRAHDVVIERIILTPDFHQMLFAQAPETRRLAPRFMKREAWVRHDEHYHVDFAVPCKTNAA